MNFQNKNFTLGSWQVKTVGNPLSTFCDVSFLSVIQTIEEGQVIDKKKKKKKSAEDPVEAWICLHVRCYSE